MKTHLVVLVIGAFGLGASPLLAADAHTLAAQLAAGEKVTVVDVRSTDHFKAGRIPGAINIPAALCPDKRLPPLGRVVVYDGGLGETNATFAAAVLSRKPGITAEVLEGGFAVWEATQRETTALPGLKQEKLPFITYADLKASRATDLVLVDLRSPDVEGPMPKSAKEPTPLTDLQGEFPNARLTRDPFATGRTGRSSRTPPPLLVLIDRNDGRAQATARTLRLNGITRFVILAGGEDILARHGQPGLQRSGTTVTVPGPAQPTQPSTGN